MSGGGGMGGSFWMGMFARVGQMGFGIAGAVQEHKAAVQQIEAEKKFLRISIEKQRQDFKVQGELRAAELTSLSGGIDSAAASGNVGGTSVATLQGTLALGYGLSQAQAEADLRIAEFETVHGFESLDQQRKRADIRFKTQEFTSVMGGAEQKGQMGSAQQATK